MVEIHQYHHQPPHQSQPQPQPEQVFEQRQQQKLMTEQSVDNFSFFNYFNSQCNNNNNYHQQQQQQQQQQTLQQFQNLPTNHSGSFPFHQHFHQQQYVEQQQRRLQPDNNPYHHHYQQPSCSRDNNNNNNFRGFITGGGSSGGGIPIPSIPLDLNGSCRNDNDVTASQFTSVVRPSHFWTLNRDICGDRRDKSGDYINEADDNDKDREYHNQNQNHQPEMNQNQNQKQNFGYDDHDGQEVSSRRYLSELEEVLCGNTSTSSPPPPSILDEFIINHLNAKKAGKQVVKEVVEQEMQPSPSTVADHDHDTKKKKRSRERDEEIIKLIQTLVKQFLNQQEVLFMKFMERIEKMDKERKERDESWRRREIENLQLKFSVFPKSHIENIALQTMPPPTTTTTTITTTTRDGGSGSGGSSSSKRWPDEEVDALIQERMKLAERFQEPGLKWPLWKEISNRMCSMGYHQRDAKRCKEKWDNINKYFRKYREQIRDGRRQKLKTCVYFDKLDQLYNSNSNSIINGGCYGGGGGDVDIQQIQGEEISVKKTDVRLVEEEEEVEVEWDELDSRF